MSNWKNNGKAAGAVRTALAFHGVLVLLEIIALVHDIYSFGPGLFQYYTVDSNVLQLAVSCAVIVCLVKSGEDRIPGSLKTLHLVCAVCLTITFLIALLVLAPQEGFAYYFLSDVAPINHFLGPLLSVLSFLFLEKAVRLPKTAVLAPLAATLVYGVAALILNGAGILDGPYFFLRVRYEAVSTIALWFGIISVLCLFLSAVYLAIRGKVTR